MGSTIEDMLQTPIERRGFGALIGLGIASATMPLEVRAQGEKYQVLYSDWIEDIDEVTTYHDQLRKMLGPEAAPDVQIVRRKQRNESGRRVFGVVYKRDKDRASSEQVAAAHSKILEPLDLGTAGAIADSELELIFNVSYGVGPNFDAAQKIFGKVYSKLGARLGKYLAIEQTKSGKFAVVYKRREDLKSTKAVAKTHGKLLSESGIKTWFLREVGNEILFDETTYLHEEGIVAPILPEPITSPRQIKPVPKKVEPKETPRTKYQPAPEQKKVEPPKSLPKGPTDLAGLIQNYVTSAKTTKGLEINSKKIQLPQASNVAFYAYDLTSGKEIAALNANSAVQSASMMKLFAYVAFGIKQGAAPIDALTRNALKYVIWKSDNVATNYIIKKIGGPKEVEKLIRGKYPEMAKGLRIDDYIPLTQRDKNKAARWGFKGSVQSGKSFYANLASAADYGSLLKAVWYDKVPLSKELKEDMSLPGSDRIFRGVPEIPNGTRVYNKTGSTARMIGDGGILVAKGKDGKEHPYIVVGIVDNPSRQSYLQFASAAGGLIRALSGAVYKHMQGQHNLM